MRRALAILLAAAATSVALPAAAIDPEAVKKFEEGKKLRAEGNCRDAIRPFEESVRAEASIGAHYNLGYCHEQLHEPLAAYESYRAAAKMAHARGDAREQEIKDATARVLETLHYVRLTVPETIVDTPGLTIAVDGEVVPRSAFADEVVVRDRPVHDVVVRATGRKDWVVANQPDHKSVIALLGDPAPAAAPPPPPPAPAPREGRWGVRQWSALGLGVAGLAAVTVAGVWIGSYVVEEARLDADRRDKCRPTATGACKDEEPFTSANAAYNDHEDATKREAPVFVTVGAAGLLMIGGGVLLYLTAPKQAAPAAGRVTVVPSIGSRSGGLLAVGRF